MLKAPLTLSNSKSIQFGNKVKDDLLSHISFSIAQVQVFVPDFATWCVGLGYKQFSNVTTAIKLSFVNFTNSELRRVTHFAFYYTEQFIQF